MDGNFINLGSSKDGDQEHEKNDSAALDMPSPMIDHEQVDNNQNE